MTNQYGARALTTQMFSELKLDNSSPTGLAWNVSKWRVTEGEQAGFLDRKNNVYKIRLNKREYRCSRVVYFLFYGQDPGDKMVVHNDGNPTNMLPENLSLKVKGAK